MRFGDLEDRIISETFVSGFLEECVRVCVIVPVSPAWSRSYNKGPHALDNVKHVSGLVEVICTYDA